MKVEITLKRILALLAVIAWIAAFIQAFNFVWGFWRFPVTPLYDWLGDAQGSGFNSWPWLASAVITVIIAVFLTVTAACLED